MRRSSFLLTSLALSTAQVSMAPAQSLHTQWPDITAHYGTVMTTVDGARYVIYGPLDRLWLLDADGTILDHAYIERRSTPVEHMRLHWSGGWSDMITATSEHGLTFGDETVPLVAHYDLLLSKPLARAVGPLPAGAQLNRGLHIFDVRGDSLGNWDSRGDRIVLRLKGAQNPIWLEVTDLVAALKPEEK